MINIKQKLEDCIKTNKELIESVMFVNGEHITPHNKQFIGKTRPIGGKKLLNIGSCQEMDLISLNFF